ncbi:glycoside hydrolase family 18 protein [Streptomyces chilikensis]|uniref:glycoside hydrolase family 18 protein n=1 Tax=Streptomyces chilikensis TaxID=1194079 RepID=UPI003F4CF785
MPRRLFSAAGVVTSALALVVGLAPASSAAPDSASAVSGASVASVASGRNTLRQVGYFTQWGVYGRDFQVRDVDLSGQAERLTHLNYAFGNVGPEGECLMGNVPGETDAWADYVRPVDAADSVDGVADTWDQPLAGNFLQLRKLKEKHPDLKVMISLGGWSWSTHFSDAALTDASRKRLVSSCIDLYIKGDLPADSGRGGPGSAAGVFDGIDLDWEWPGSAGDTDTTFRPEDRKNFTKLVAEFRKQLDALGKRQREHYELSAFVPTAEAKIDAGFEVPKIMRNLDFVTLQGYDFHVSGEPVTNQQSALFARNDHSVHGTVEAWLERGAPARKLVVGVPFYGQGWTGVTGGGDGLGQPAAGPAPARWADGYADYEELKALVESGSWTVHRDRAGGHAWIFDGTTLWTYDDPRVLARKAAYVKDRGLGGAMIWSLDGDTSDGELIRALDAGLND